MKKLGLSEHIDIIAPILLSTAIFTFLMLILFQSPPPPTPDKHIYIDKTNQKLYLREYKDDPGIVIPITAGATASPTATGEFEVLSKLGDVSSYHGYTFPLWVGIYSFNGYENGIHSVEGDDPWSKHIGWKNSTPGSVIVSIEDMELIYEWVEVGDRISIVN